MKTSTLHTVWCLWFLGFGVIQSVLAPDNVITGLFFFTVALIYHASSDVLRALGK